MTITDPRDSIAVDENDQAESSDVDPTRICIGRVGAPPQKEATSTGFYFWIARDRLVETTQLVTCMSKIAGQIYPFHALVTEVYRQSRQRSMGSEVDVADGNVQYQPPFANDGFTYAAATILRTPVFTPPQERSPVYLASTDEARISYGAEDILAGRALEIGLIKNGANEVAGAGMIDLDYLLGTNGGHMNVNGSAGRGTKSSFLLFMNRLLLRRAQLEKASRPSDNSRLRIVPIILNVKGFDLFHIDRWSNRYQPEKHLADWVALGINNPQPFQSVSFYAPAAQDPDIAVPTGRYGKVEPYSWSLSDVIARGLFSYLFAETDANDANFGSLVLDIESWLTKERVQSGETTRELRDDEGVPQTFRKLLDWVDNRGGQDDSKWRNHHPSTWKKLYRRLLKLVYECQGVLRIDEQTGAPLDVTRSGPRLSITWKFSTRTQIYKDYASDIPNTNALLFPTVWCINLANMIRVASPRNFKQFSLIFMTGEKNEKVCSQMISELKERPQTFCATLLQSLRTIFKNVLLTIQIRRQFWP